MGDLSDQTGTPLTADTPETQATPGPRAPTPPPDVGLRNSLRDIARNLVISGVIPLIIYNLLKGRGAST